MKVAIDTIGCRFNQVESAEMRGILEENGFEVTDSSNKPDIYIINTCTVTGKSDNKSKLAIKKFAKSHKDSFIIVTGCYAQMNKEEAASLENVSLVLGNDEKLDIIEHLNALISNTKENKIVVNDINKEKSFKSHRFKNYLGQSRAFVKIQTGCNHKCSYCLVTIARGNSSSCEPLEVEHQIRSLADKGFKEIVLSGVHVGSYGIDLKPKTDLCSLLRHLISTDKIERIRLSSISPTEIPDNLISLIQSSNKICEHLHIPLQSGDDTVLKKMRRNYNSKYFHELILKLKLAIPDLCIGLDVMVGFPGESEDKFYNTYDLIKSLPIAYMHIFRYSPRKGTEAFNFKDTIDEKEKKRRSALLQKLSDEKKTIFQKAFLGKRKKIVIEAKRDTKTGLLKGVTDNYINVLIDENDSFMNKVVNVTLCSIKDEKVIGKKLFTTMSGSE